MKEKVYICPIYSDIPSFQEINKVYYSILFDKSNIMPIYIIVYTLIKSCETCILETFHQIEVAHPQYPAHTLTQYYVITLLIIVAKQ